MFRRFFSTAPSKSLFTRYMEGVKPSVKEISWETLDLKLTAAPDGLPYDHFHLIDVRETYEWNDEHIPHATFASRGTLERDIEALVPDVNDEIVLYCASGARSILAAESLTRMGYKNVSSLEGGIANWRSNNNIIRKNMRTFSPIQEY